MQQSGHPIAFISKALSKRHLGLSVYEKKLLFNVHAVEKWRHYLLGRHFIIRTNHRSLKYLLEHRLHNENQFRWLSQLIEFDYEIVYKKGKENVVAHVSRIQGPEHLSIAPIVENGKLLDEIKQRWARDPQLQSAIQLIEEGQPSLFMWKQGLLLKKGKLVVGKDVTLRQEIIKIFHTTTIAGHSGVHGSTKRISSFCFWKGLEKDVCEFIRACEVC